MRFGCPRVVSTDNRTEFTGRIFEKMLEEFHIVHRTTPFYHP